MSDENDRLLKAETDGGRVARFGSFGKSILDKITTRRTKSAHGGNQNLLGYLFILPNIVVFGIFLFLPVLFGFFISFHEWSLLSQERTWVGLQHYFNLWDPAPWANNWEPIREPFPGVWWFAVRNTVLYTVITIPLAVFGGLFVALILNNKIKGRVLYRAAFFVPVMMAGAASAVVWRWILAEPGILNYFLEPLGLAANWAGNPETALYGVMVIAVWAGIGFNMILYLAGLQNIPTELYESARLDGANRWQRFRHVTWPSLQNVTFFVVVLAIINSFQVFAYALVFSGDGGPYYATTTIVVLIYRRAFDSGEMGAASAMAVHLFAVIFLFTYFRYKTSKQDELGY